MTKIIIIFLSLCCLKVLSSDEINNVAFLEKNFNQQIFLKCFEVKNITNVKTPKSHLKKSSVIPIQ